MNIYLRDQTSIAKEDILAVVDRKTLLKTKDGRAFLNSLESKPLIAKSREDIKTLIVVEDEGKIKAYGSDISSNSIKNKFNMKGLKK